MQLSPEERLREKIETVRNLYRILQALKKGERVHCIQEEEVLEGMLEELVNARGEPFKCSGEFHSAIWKFIKESEERLRKLKEAAS